MEINVQVKEKGKLSKKQVKKHNKEETRETIEEQLGIPNLFGFFKKKKSLSTAPLECTWSALTVSETATSH